MRWAPVVGWEGRYEVSDEGQVRSVDRAFTDRAGRSCVRGGRLRRLTPTTNGYLHLNLFPGGYPQRVHRLVLDAFLGPCPAGMECRHLNGDKTDNRLENLAWDTHRQNMQDQVTHGTRVDRHGEGNGRARLTVELVQQIRASDKPASEWARELGVHRSTITDARSGRRWSET